jgi:hypothetical protein
MGVGSALGEFQPVFIIRDQAREREKETLLAYTYLRWLVAKRTIEIIALLKRYSTSTGTGTRMTFMYKNLAAGLRNYR